MNNTTSTQIVSQFIREGGNHAFESKPIPEELFGVPMFFIWNMIFILVLAVIFYWLVRGKSHPHNETPLDLLKKRYINGEIDKEKYEDMKKVIKE
jgi:uncharacterized membrane protein